MEANGRGLWKPYVLDKLLTICHAAAYFVALLAQEGQKIFWMSDHDVIAPNEPLRQEWLRIFGNCVAYYANRNFPVVSGAVPFQEKSLMTLDLLSASDLTAGAIEQHLTKHGDSQRGDVDLILNWLGGQGVGLKKWSILIQTDDAGRVQSCGLEFIPIEPTERIIPIFVERP